MAAESGTIRRRNSMCAGSSRLRTPVAALDFRRVSDTVKLVCRPCQDSGNRNTATAYCGQCHIYMCSACQMGHSAKAKRSHSMPQGSQVHNNVRYNCVKHKSKAIQYFCISHNVLGCHECVVNNHKSCAKVQAIPDIIQHMESCKIIEENDELVETLKNALKHALKNKAGLIEKEERIGEKRDRAVNKVRQLREQMNELFDTVESEVESQANRLKDEDMEKIKTQSLEYDYIITNIENLLTELEIKTKEDRGSELFVAMKTTETNIELIKDKLAELEEDNLISNYDFVPEREVRKILHGKATLGSIQKDREAAFLVDVNVKTSKDKSTCWVSGVVEVSEDSFLVADHENSCIKIINTSENKVKARLPLPSPPWDIAKVEDKCVAVTLPDDKRILLLKVGSKLTILSVLPVESECCGISYSNQKFFVTCMNPATVIVLDLQGNVLKTIANDRMGKPLFSNPFHIVTSPDQKYVYVSDVHEHSVTCLAMDGTFVNAYKSYSLTGPMGLTADIFGNVYVCGGWSNTVHRLKPDCSDGKDILRNMSEPQAITLSRDQKKFYIGKLASNRIAVYKID